MNPTVGRILSLLARGSAPAVPTLDGFVDSLLQKFENCRQGLKDEALGGAPGPVETFFLDLYEKELPRLRDAVRREEPHLTPAAREEYVRKVDELVRKVLVPAYVRVSAPFTRRERNDFYVLPASLHLVERLFWGGLGIAAGSFVVWAPFIPIWSKDVVLPFAVAGLFFPNLRQYLSMRRYERELNQLVSRADREIGRIDTAYLTSGEAEAERDRGEASEAALEPESPEAAEARRRLAAALAAAAKGDP
ncbi:hypothetical protein FBQ97_16995 [Acidobacteria bacterium ACD]|nr:MAG: hypothetical protein EDX89_17050 [Acidobacteriota bacterium]MDL1951493.1 hypothetical protein [Acidobacteria bacterium ACD]